MKKHKKKLTTFIAAVLVAIIIPVSSGYALTSSGTFFQDMYSGVPGASWQVANGYVKYNYHPGALLSRYYFTDSSNATYFAYPITAPVNSGEGETQNVYGSELTWAQAMNGGSLSSAIPNYGVWLSFRDTPDGGVTSYAQDLADYSTLFEAYATILRYGYGGYEDKSTAFGLYDSAPDQAQRYYATNMAMQRISGQAYGTSDYGGYGLSGVRDMRAINFEWFLEQQAKLVLCKQKPTFSNLQGCWGTPTRLNSTTISIPLTVNIAAGEDPRFYSNNTGFYWTDLSTLSRQNEVAVANTMSNFGGGSSVTSNLLINSSSIKGGEHLAFAVSGAVSSMQTSARIFAAWGGRVQSFIIGDPSSVGSKSIVKNLDTVYISTTLPLFDVQTTGITCNASYNAGDTGTVSVTYKNNSTLPAVNVPVSLSCSSSLGAPFTITNPNQTISELQAGASATVTYNIKANTLGGDTTATFTAKIGYNTDNSTRFNETNYANNTLTKTTTLHSVPDFSCTFPVSGYIAGQDAVFAVTVNNGGVIGNPNVPVRLTVGSTSYDTTIPVPVGSNLAVFRVTMPNVTGNVTVTAVVDPNNVIPELNETNNTVTHSAPVTQLQVPSLIDAEDSGLKQVYLGKNKALPAEAPDNPDTVTHTWQEYRFESGNYVLHTYTATLSVTFTVKPDSRVSDNTVIQSGFGIEQAAAATLATNYDHPEKLVGIQDVWLTYPETYYGLDSRYYTGYYEIMTPDSTGALSGSWKYPNNPNSVKNMPLHYIPLWYPDGEYTVLCTAWYGWTPNGQLSMDTSGSVTVSGDMYDRITAVGY